MDGAWRQWRTSNGEPSSSNTSERWSPTKKRNDAERFTFIFRIFLDVKIFNKQFESFSQNYSIQFEQKIYLGKVIYWDKQHSKFQILIAATIKLDKTKRWIQNNYICLLCNSSHNQIRQNKSFYLRCTTQMDKLICSTSTSTWEMPTCTPWTRLASAMSLTSSTTAVIQILPSTMSGLTVW